MGSRLEYRDETMGTTRTATLVYPDEAMAGPPRHAMQQEGSAGDGFQAAVGIGQAAEQAPPVVNHTARHHTAPLQIVGGEATPTPLGLVEPIFGASTSRANRRRRIRRCRLQPCNRKVDALPCQP
jgi:hypothetical protein